MKFKTVYRLHVANLFYVGLWDKEPTQQEIVEAMKKRFEKNVEFINGERLTFQVEKINLLVSDEVNVGDFVEVVNSFQLEEHFYEFGEKFQFHHLHKAVGLEMNVKKVN